MNAKGLAQSYLSTIAITLVGGGLYIILSEIHATFNPFAWSTGYAFLFLIAFAVWIGMVAIDFLIMRGEDVSTLPKSPTKYMGSELHSIKNSACLKYESKAILPKTLPEELIQPVRAIWCTQAYIDWKEETVKLSIFMFTLEKASGLSEGQTNFRFDHFDIPIVQAEKLFNPEGIWRDRDWGDLTVAIINMLNYHSNKLL